MAVSAKAFRNLYGTNGTVYLLGTGKVELEGTDYSDTGRAAAVSSGGGSSGGGVSKEYVDGADTITLSSAKKYTDDKTAEIKEKIPTIPESLPADGGNADTAKHLEPTVYVANNNNPSTYTKLLEIPTSASRFQNTHTFVFNQGNVDGLHDNYGVLHIRADKNTNGYLYFKCTINKLSENLNITYDDLFLLGKSEMSVALFIHWGTAWNFVELTAVNDVQNAVVVPQSFEFLSEFPSEYEKYDAVYLNIDDYKTELADLKGYIGYTDSDIYGLEVDFENNRFTRLAGAVGKNPGADFDSVNAFGGRRRCALADDGTVIACLGDDNYVEDGSNGQVMVEQPKFYYKVVPLKTEKIEGADGYHLRKARYYISYTPKAGFKVHPAFVQNGIEAD